MSKALPIRVAAAVDRYLDDPKHCDDCSNLGQHFFEVFGSDKGMISTQMRNLQQVACSATRFSDIEDFVKNQMGKDRGSATPWRKVGQDALDHLAQLRAVAKQLSEGKAEEPEKTELAVRLKLARASVRSVVSEYLYRKARQEMELPHDEH